MLVREVMSNEAITVPLGTTVKSALAVLASARITSLPVVSASGKLRGIVSEADLIRDGVSADAAPARDSARERPGRPPPVRRRRDDDRTSSRSVPTATWPRPSS